MSDDDTGVYGFDSPTELLSIANQPALQAEEKELFALAEPADETSGLYLSNEDGVRAQAVNLEGFKAVYNPESGRVFDAVTDEYEIINPPEFLGPLCGLLNERGRDDVNGEVFVRNGGAQGFGTLLFANKHSIYLPGRGRSNPVRVGFTFRWSHDGGISVKAQGFAQDTACKNSIRQVTSSIHVKHSGDVDGRIDWESEWKTVLNELGAFSEALAGIIEEAMGHEFMDFRPDAELPVNPREMVRQTDPLDTLEGVETPPMVSEDMRNAAYGFFELLGFPKYLGVSATDRLMYRLSQKDDPRVATAWDVYSAATYALTHTHRGTPGASDDDKYRTANDILLNPMAAWESVESELRSRVGGTADAPTLDVSGGEEDGEETVGDALRSYHERAEALEASFGGD